MSRYINSRSAASASPELELASVCHSRRMLDGGAYDDDAPLRRMLTYDGCVVVVYTLSLPAVVVSSSHVCGCGFFEFDKDNDELAAD